MRVIRLFLILLATAVPCAVLAQEVDYRAMEDARKVSGLLKSDFRVHYDAGKLKNGSAVYNADRDLAFWVSGDTIYAVNDRARAAVPDLSQAPPDVTYDAVYEASCTSAAGREVRPGDIAMKGREMSAEDAVKLEESVKTNPADVWARTMLLGYYGGKRFTSTDDREAFERHVLWLIRNVPEAAVVGSHDAQLIPHMDSKIADEAAALMKEHVGKDPRNLLLLANAANFFLISDKAYAVECLTKCCEIEPNNPQWHEKLGFIHSMESRTAGFLGMPSAPDGETAKKALAEQERALELTADNEKKLDLMRDTAETAFAAGDLDKARKYASAILEGTKKGYNWDRGNLIYTGNSVLGRIALREGDIEKAKDHLIAAAKCGGSPQLDSFGPDMSLASELLEKGEKETVIKYLELCGGFWNKAATDLWIKGIKDGKQVDLNPMLAMAYGRTPPAPPNSSHVIEDRHVNWNTPLLTLPMPTSRLRDLDALYGVPLLLLLAAVLWIRLFSSWQHLWILVPLGLAFAVPITLARNVPGLSGALFGLDGRSVQHLIATYFGSLALLWLLSDLLARLETRQIAPAAVIVMAFAGLLGTVNYPYGHHMTAEVLTFIIVVTASFALARACCARKWSAVRFVVLLFVFDVLFMLAVWPAVWFAMLWLFTTETLSSLNYFLPQHLVISVINGVGLCVFLTPFLLMTACVPLYRGHFRTLFRIPDAGQS